MRTFTDSTLNALDRLGGKFGPLNSLIGGIAERIAPNITAQACTATQKRYICDQGCTSNRCGHLLAYVTQYAETIDDCWSHNYSCQIVQCIC